MSERYEERLTRLETAIMHLQHDFESLNESVVRHEETFKRLRETLDRLDGRIGDLEPEDSKRDPGEERPPHY